MAEYIKYKYIEKKDTDQLTYESYINKNFSNANNSGIIKYQPVTQNNETTDTTSEDRTFPTFRVANSKITLNGVIRYNYSESRFEICKSNVLALCLLQLGRLVWLRDLMKSGCPNGPPK